MLKDMRTYIDNRFSTTFSTLCQSLILGTALLLTQISHAVSIPNSDPRSEARDLDTPSFHYVRPSWGIELTSTLNAFGSTALTEAQARSPAYALKLQGEYQPPFLQSFGVFGIGPAFSVYPIMKSGLTPNAFAMNGIGGQFRYQALYFHQQPIVPMAAYTFEYFRYRYLDGTSGAFVLQGPTLGVWVLLNFLDSPSAANLYVDNRIARTYLTVEWQALAGKDTLLDISGGSYYVGLRLEF